MMSALLRRAPMLVVFAALASVALFAPDALPQSQEATSIEGKVRTSTGEPVADAAVSLEREENVSLGETKTNTQGGFVFSPVAGGTYAVTVKKPGWRVHRLPAVNISAGITQHVDLVLERLPAQEPAGAMEFDDKPNFTVAGVTDWNNVSIHGSDVSLRTSEALAKETLALKAGGPGEDPAKAGDSEKALRAALVQAPESFAANHALGEFYCLARKYSQAIPYLEKASGIDPVNSANTYSLALAYRGIGEPARARQQVRGLLKNADHPDAHRLLGELDEQLSDPLEAVREYQRAAELDPSEPNYFEWGTELLLHRADRPAVEVFAKGSAAHPDSARLLAGMGAALSAGGSYEEAAKRLCQASDLHPADSAPYLFLGKIEKAAPVSLPCAEEALARFAKNQPDNASANYYYAIAMWKRERGAGKVTREVDGLLEKAVSLDPKMGEAYLQIGTVRAARGEFASAIGAYKKSVEVSPQLGEAHYRLGLAYRRLGEEANAKQEFQLYERGEQIETAAVESQRREVRQFLIVLKDQPVSPSSR